MSNSSISTLWKLLTNLSGTDALLLGLLLLCAIGGAAIAIYIAISAALDTRRTRRSERMHHAAPRTNRHA
jgi:hypothetical protein